MELEAGPDPSRTASEPPADSGHEHLWRYLTDHLDNSGAASDAVLRTLALRDDARAAPDVWAPARSADPVHATDLTPPFFRL
jgi:hypothetical protein